MMTIRLHCCRSVILQPACEPVVSMHDCAMLCLSSMTLAVPLACTSPSQNPTTATFAAARGDRAAREAVVSSSAVRHSDNDGEAAFLRSPPPFLLTSLPFDPSDVIPPSHSRILALASLSLVQARQEQGGIELNSIALCAAPHISSFSSEWSTFWIVPC